MKGKVVAFLSVLLTLSAAPAMAGETINWIGCGISKLGFMQDLAAAYEKETGVKINLEGGGATKGIRQVQAGSHQLGGSCRMPLVHRNEHGEYIVESSENKVSMIPVGWDALVVITSKDNNMISSISRRQLRKVLTGEITDWKDLGAAQSQPIKLYIRKGKISGVGLTLRQQLFGNKDQEFTKNATVLASSGKIEKAVEKDPYGIAISGISSSRHRQLNMLELDGVKPTPQTLEKGTYQLYRILFLTVGHDFAKVKEVKDFVDFSLSSEGSDIIRKAGTLPYRHGLSLLSSGASQEYLQTLDIIDQSGMYNPAGSAY